MVTDYNASKEPAKGEFLDIKKYIGVSSISVLAVNPKNDVLRKYGWKIADDAEEPKYIIVSDKGGVKKQFAKVRFLVQLLDMKDQPVIAMDFLISPKARTNSNKELPKVQIIDSYGRTAWATEPEFRSKSIPQYEKGPASISSDYKACHGGEADIVLFLMKFLNVTPLQVFSRSCNAWVPSKTPGRLTIDNWEALCNGNAKEIVDFIKLMPDNKVRVCFGVQTTDDNKTYQTFMTDYYASNGSRPDGSTGLYTSFANRIEKNSEMYEKQGITFSAAPIKEWSVSATEVAQPQPTMFDENGNFNDAVDRLPFDVEDLPPFE